MQAGSVNSGVTFQPIKFRHLLSVADERTRIVNGPKYAKFMQLCFQLV